MYKVFVFSNLENYKKFAEELCSECNFRIIDVCNFNSMLLVTIYEEEISGY